MTSQFEKNAFFQEVLDDHVDLKKLLGKIEIALEERTVPAAEVFDLFGELEDRLQSHFLLEEDGGYFVEALSHSPRIENQVRGLMEQHPAIIDKCRNIAIEIRPAVGKENFWEVANERFQGFKVNLLKHERGEDDLLQDAYVRDIGDHD